MGFKFGNRSLHRMDGVHEDIKRVAHRAIQITKVDFGIPQYGGTRTEMEQNELYLNDLSDADGFTNKSYHQTGNALDFYALDPDTGEASWDHLLMTHIAAAFLQAACELGITITWGGFWKTRLDMPHIQREDT